MTNRAIEKDGVLYFKCRRCGKIKPLNSTYFHRNTTAMMGYNSKCIECVREEMNTIYKPKKRYITKAELEEENKKLNEKVSFLEECLDRKEKLNEEYRKEIEELKSTYVYDAKQVRDIC